MPDRNPSPIDAPEGPCLPSCGSRLLLIAFACHPDNSMEERNGWNRALQAAQDFDVTVVCSPYTSVNELQERTPPHLAERLNFITVSAGAFGDFCLTRELLFYLGYRFWHSQVFEFARKMHAESPFSITHMVSVCGYREPGYVWRLDCPFVWGPIGGTSNFPLKFLRFVDPLGGLYEIARNSVNLAQLHYGSRVRRAGSQAAAVFAANRSTQRDLEHCTGLRLLLELETGLDYEPQNAKALTSADRPLRILWVGRLRPWKGLPLLLHALAKLPESQKCELRVVGDGGCKATWIRLARRLKIDDQITWFGKPPYRDSLHHYEWADVFAFTSLRDTSGTGLLESLAAGVPVIGLDHQGAADMITEKCGIRIPVSNPTKSIAAIAQALIDLSRDRQRLHALSQGASLQAYAYTWSQREPLVRRCYAASTNATALPSTQTEPALVH